MKKQRKTLKYLWLRILAVLMVLIMIIGAVPVSAASKSIKVSSKKKLVAELKKSNSETIVFTSSTSKTVTIPSVKTAKNKKLVINAPKAKIVNKSTLKSMTLEACGTFTEKASGNTIILKDKNTIFMLASGKKISKLTASATKANITVAKKSAIDNLVCNKKSASVKLDVASGADVNVRLSKKTSIEVTGSVKADVDITASAKSSSVTASVPVELDAKADLKLNLVKGSEGSVVNSSKSVSVKVDNNSAKTPTIKEDGKVVSEAKNVTSDSKDNANGKNNNDGKNDTASESKNSNDDGKEYISSSDNSTGNVGTGSNGGSIGFGPGLSGGGTSVSEGGSSAETVSGGFTGGVVGENTSGGSPSGNTGGEIISGGSSGGSYTGSTDPIPVQTPEQPSNPGQTNSPSTNIETPISPSTNPETSTSPNSSPEVSTSPSAAPEVSTSPSVNPDKSISPSENPKLSPSPSETPEISPSSSERTETSPSPAENSETSPSPAENPETSPSPAENPETSPSPSENPETSPSPAENPEISPSPIENPETSPSPSEDPETSPSPTENPETSPSPTENPETSPSPSENSEISPSPIENPETSPSPAENPEISSGPSVSPIVTATPTPEGTATIRIKYGQSDARAMFNKINTYRTSNGVTKDLIYDYDLEKVAMQRAAEIAILYDEDNHNRPDGNSYKKTLSEYGFDISPRNILYGENIAFSVNDNPGNAETGFSLFTGGDTAQLMLGSFNYVGIGHIRINKTDYWVQVFSNEKNRPASTVTDALDGEKDITINIPNRFVESVTPVYVSGNTSVSVGSTVAVPVYTAKATFVDSDAGEVTVVGNLAFESENAYVKASNGMMTGLQAGTGSISASLLGKTVSVDITVNAASPLQQLIDNAESYPNIVLNVSDSEVAKSEADVNKPIYDRVTSNYTSGLLVVNSFDLLKSEEDYVASFPSVKTIVFSNAKIYKNVSTVNFAITYKEHSFLSEERAVDYALTNGSEAYLTTFDKELYDKIVTLSATLRGNTEYDTVKNIHDYLVENIAYTLPQSSQDMSVYSARGALFQFQSVCDGYAKSFYLLCKACGVEAVYVAGTATNRSGASENHAWNKVKVAGKWYAIDCTWDDPTPDNAGVVRYDYFLITDQDMAINHVWDDTDLPAATSADLGVVYETYKNVPKFTSDADAIAYIREELGKVFNQSGFSFTITVLSSDGSTLGNDIKSLAAEYNSTYGCGYSYHAESAGFYGTKYDVEIYK